MQIELRGTIRAALGSGSVELEVPAAGCSLSSILEKLSESSPRLGAALTQLRPGYTLRAVVNGVAVNRADDPVLHEADTVLLLVAMQGG